MTLFIILAVVFLAAYILSNTFIYNDLVLGLTVISGILLLLALAFWPISHYTEIDNITKYHAIEQTVEKARNNGISVENAAMIIKIIEANEWLASAQYWNNTIFDVFIPDAVDDLKPLE